MCNHIFLSDEEEEEEESRRASLLRAPRRCADIAHSCRAAPCLVRVKTQLWLIFTGN